MILPPTILLFSLSAFLLLIFPGPSVVFISTKSISAGRREGLKSVLGVEIGGMTHAILAAAGLSIILMESSFSFNIVKYLGAGYLFYLGARTLIKSKESGVPQTTSIGKNSSNSFINGFFVDLLNPKVALFFYAFLPQFVVPGYGSYTFQILLFGLVWTSIAFCTDSIYAVLSSTAKEKLSQRLTFLTGKMKFISAGTYIALGIVAATSSFKSNS